LPSAVPGASECGEWSYSEEPYADGPEPGDWPWLAFDAAAIAWSFRCRRAYPTASTPSSDTGSTYLFASSSCAASPLAPSFVLDVKASFSFPSALEPPRSSRSDCGENVPSDASCLSFRLPRSDPRLTSLFIFILKVDNLSISNLLNFLIYILQTAIKFKFEINEEILYEII
jgi:hypothetical protein